MFVRQTWTGDFVVRNLMYLSVVHSLEERSVAHMNQALFVVVHNEKDKADWKNAVAEWMVDCTDCSLVVYSWWTLFAGRSLALSVD